MIDRIDLSYRQHRIIAGTPRKSPLAFVYEAGRKLAELDGETVTQAVGSAKAWIDERLDRERRGRRRSYIGTVAEYVRAFGQLELGVHHLKMLRAHMAASGQALSARNSLRPPAMTISRLRMLITAGSVAWWPNFWS